MVNIGSSDLFFYLFPRNRRKQSEPYAPHEAQPWRAKRQQTTTQFPTSPQQDTLSPYAAHTQSHTPHLEQNERQQHSPTSMLSQRPESGAKQPQPQAAMAVEKANPQTTHHFPTHVMQPRDRTHSHDTTTDTNTNPEQTSTKKAHTPAASVRIDPG